MRATAVGFSIMTVLVTGGAGYIGSHMVYALVDAGERVVVLDNLTTGFDWAVAKAPVVVGETAIRRWWQPMRSTRRAVIHFAPRSWCRLGSRIRSATTQQHGELARLDRDADQGRRAHFIFSSTARLRQSRRACGGEDDPRADVAIRLLKLMTEIMLRDAGLAHGLRHVILRYFNVAGADPHGRTGQSPRAHPPHQGGGRDRARPRPRWTCSAPTTRRRRHLHPRLHPQCRSGARAFRCARLSAWRGASATLNCGYGRGFSVLEVIDTVKRVAGVDFKIDVAERRPGDPARVVAASTASGRRSRGSRNSTICRHRRARARWERKRAERTR
jgi:UDP-glucose 4-epimerase